MLNAYGPNWNLGVVVPIDGVCNDVNVIGCYDLAVEFLDLFCGIMLKENEIKRPEIYHPADSTEKLDAPYDLQTGSAGHWMDIWVDPALRRELQRRDT